MKTDKKEHKRSNIIILINFAQSTSLSPLPSHDKLRAPTVINKLC